ncbi:MAG: type II toxin-antitoxin system RelE/ParE family toxin [Candidatus Aminicenantes bacterium]|nr:type II toxin-antitoxin system RelE/ParE family toxin [Candidatus Aminicenantes bacterium]
MRLVETAKFKKLRKKIKEKQEKEALKEAIVKILENPEDGKKLKGEFINLRSFRDTVKGQSKRLTYKKETDTIVLFSFGPREGIYKK